MDDIEGPARRGARHCRYRNISRRTLAALAVASCFATGGAFANPTGMTVANGTAVPLQAGNLLQITNSPNAIVNWQSFSIAAGEITRFIQQSAASAVLNRVTTQNPSQILGALQSNGRVFLINPSGIVFGAGAQIDVAGLVASSLNISDTDFLSGRLRFSETPGAGSVVNQGAITTPSGGNVYLVGPAVTNSGIITSPQGEVVLAAGNKVELVDPASPNLRVEIAAPDNQALNLGHISAEAGRIGIYAGLINQKGAINADSAVVGENGSIVLRATKNATLDAGSVTTANGPAGGAVTIQSGDTTIVAGSVEARGLGSPPAGGGVAQSAGVMGVGGTVKVLGNLVGLTGNARIDASGETGGGTVLVGGDFQGTNPDIQNAFRTYVGPDATIRADAITNGDGGKVVIWSDDATRFYGTISVRGGEQAGNGGFVEVSGRGYLDFRGHVDLNALNGRGGELLLDPTDIIVAAAAGTLDGELNGTADPTIAFGDATGSTTLNVTELTAGFASGNTITLQATNNIRFDTNATLQSGVHLVLEAGNDINIGTTANATVTAVGTGTLTLRADANGPNGTGSINIGSATTVGGLVVSNQAITLKAANLVIDPTQASTTVNAGTTTGQVNIFTSQPATATIGVGTATGTLTVSNAELGKIAAKTLVIGDSTAQVGNITFKGATPVTGRNVTAAQLVSGAGTIVLDDTANTVVPLTTGAGNISLSAGTGGITANATNSTAEFSTTTGTVTLNTSGPIGTSTNRIQFSATTVPVVGDVTQPAGGVFLNGLTALNLGTMNINGNLDATAAGGISGNNAITVTGTSRFESTGAGNIALGSLNVFSDTVTLVTGGEVSLRQWSNTVPLKVAPFTVGRAILESSFGAGSELWLAGSYESTNTDFQIFATTTRLTGDTTITGAQGFFLNGSSVIGPGALTLNQNAAITSGIFLNGVQLGTSAVPLGGLTIHDASTSFPLNLYDINVTGNVDITGARESVFNSPLIASGSLTAESTGGDIQIGAGATLTANGAGNALTLAGTNFINSRGAGALSAPSGRWLVYSTSPAGSTENGLTAAAGSAMPRLYNRTYAANGPGTITQPGNHLIYSTQPMINVTANGVSRAYGDPNPALTYATSGALVNDDGVTDTLTSIGLTGALATTAVANSPVAGSPYAITQGTVISEAGYGINYTGANVTVAQRTIAATADNQAKPYGSADPALTVTVGGMGIAAGEMVGTVFSGSLVRAPGETVAASPYVITQGTLAANANYNMTGFTPGQLTIAALPLTIAADNKVKVLNDPNPPLTAAVSGFAPGEGLGSLTGMLVLRTTATDNSPLGSYPITPSGLSSTNYTITFVDGVLLVRPLQPPSDQSLIAAVERARTFAGETRREPDTVAGCRKIADSFFDCR